MALLGRRPRLLLPLLLLLVGGCLAPAPPIVVDTPYGAVRAESRETANEVAGLLRKLAPEVRALLPDSQERSIDVWVQKNLQVYRFQRRPESVRGFTLLNDEFTARRIHLQEDGQSPWYLSHELVHALIGSSWAPLPGILEEGLGDVIAERLNPEYRGHIRAHRLLNASAFTNGLELDVRYRVPKDGISRWRWPQTRRRVILRTSKALPRRVLEELLTTDRSALHERWPEIPESFYGIAWMVVSRIVEREGIDGLHRLCLEASAAGHDLVPKDWLLRAADIDLDTLDESFLRRSFGRRELLTAIYLQPDAFGRAALHALEPLRASLATSELFSVARPTFVLADESEIPLGYVRPIKNLILREWRTQ